MDIFVWVPNYTSALNETPRIRAIKFGDGYEQRSPESLSPIDTAYDLIFSELTEEVSLTIDAFLMGKKGVDAFAWTPPLTGAVLEAYICRRWTLTPIEHNNFSLRATFERDFATAVVDPSIPDTVLIDSETGATLIDSETGGTLVDSGG